MPLKPIHWDETSIEQRAIFKAMGEMSPLAFTALWFNVSQMDSFRTNWHHHYYNWIAQEMLAGRMQNVVVNVAPGATKTEFWSIHLPAYCMTVFDRVRILNTSYSKDLVNENSERTRSLIKSAEFQELYAMQVDKDKVDDWTVNHNGKRAHQVFSRPSGGQITGVRGGYMSDSFSGYIMADDWDKMDDLFSDAKRNKSHVRLTNTLRSRRASPTTPFVFIQQRGHIDDSTAYILSGGMGLSVDAHIKIPALVDQEYIDSLPDGIRERCERDVKKGKCVGGQWSYWPAKEDIDDLIALRDANPYTFLSQYMQEPNALSGGIFSAEDFVTYGDVDDGADIETPEKFDYRIITVDTAQKTKEWNDWSVFAEWGVTADRIYRLDYNRAKMEAPELRTSFEAFVKASHAKNGGAMGVLRKVMVEDKSSGTGLIQEVSKRLPIMVTAVQRQTDKLTRAMDVQAHHAAKKVALPYGDKANFEFISEVASFSHDDTHKHDDQTDVMVDALNEAFVIGKAPSRKVNFRL